MFDSQSKHEEVGIEAASKTIVPTLPQPAVTASSTGNQFVTGLGDGSKPEERSGDLGATAPQQLPGVDGEQHIQDIKNSGIPCTKLQHNF